MNIKSIAVTTSENFDTDTVYVLTEDNQIFLFCCRQYKYLMDKTSRNFKR